LLSLSKVNWSILITIPEFGLYKNDILGETVLLLKFTLSLIAIFATSHLQESVEE